MSEKFVLKQFLFFIQINYQQRRALKAGLILLSDRYTNIKACK
jgi:hypothetical protein